MKKLLLLPSARLAPPELQVDFGPIPSGMVPLHSRPALHHIAAPYARSDFEVLVAAHDAAETINHYVKRCPDLHARAVDVGSTSSIAETVAAALHLTGELPDRLVVNFADTLISEVLPGEDEICYQEQEDLYRWTAFDFDRDRAITAIYPKNELKPYAGALPVFVGVFGFSQPRRLLTLLERSMSDNPGRDDPFWAALAEYHNSLPPGARRLRKVAEWRDFGHLDTYYATQRTYFLNKRFFNTMSVDMGRGVVRKSSTHAAKLAREIEWYLSLPPAIKYLGPRVFAYSSGKGQTSAEMEYYGYPALNDVYLYGDWDLGVWNQVLAAIWRAIEGMAQYNMDANPAVLRAAMRDMYETKTAERLRPILEDPRFALFSKPGLEINGRRCLTLPECLQALPGVLEAAGLYESPRFSIIHGDLCLSNILYDRRSGFVRLVDPRGSFGGITMYGDPRYDLAKLSHSLHGDYDFYVNGLFSLEQSGAALTLQPFRRHSHDGIKMLFRDWLARRAGKSLHQVRLIESLLFLSMTPLHADRPQSQMAFLARGLELFSQVCQEIDNHPPEVFTHAGASDQHRDYYGG